MASKRNLKRDIEYLIADLIYDCYACMEEHPEKSSSDYEEIIDSVFTVKDTLLDRINHYDTQKHGKSRPYFLEIKKDLITSVTEAYEKLNRLGC